VILAACLPRLQARRRSRVLRVSAVQYRIASVDESGAVNLELFLLFAERDKVFAPQQNGSAIHIKKATASKRRPSACLLQHDPKQTTQSRTRC